MGLPAVMLPAADIGHLLECVERDPTLPIAIDLRNKRLTADREYDIEIDDGARVALVNGSWDSTSSLLGNLEQIRETAGRIPYLNNFE